jgi:dipeptide/tripeptide permease
VGINLGSILTTLLTPIFRSDVKCYGNDCFPLAFGVPAIVWLIGIIAFAIGTPYYKRTDEKRFSSLSKSSRLSENIIINTVCCICRAIVNRFILKRNINDKKHWLETADDTYSHEIIDGAKIFCNVSFLFSPLILFWTLYEQQGSKWTYQAQQLDGRFWSFIVKPEQLHIINPIVIVTFIPILDKLFYPLMGKLKMLQSELPRISFGLFLVITSFLISAILQFEIQDQFSTFNPSSQIKMINLSPCNLTLNLNETTVLELSEYKKNGEESSISTLPDYLIPRLNEGLVMNLKGQCLFQTFQKEIDQQITLKSDTSLSTLILNLKEDGLNSTNGLNLSYFFLFFFPYFNNY